LKKRRVLLLEPNYRNKYPPMGLMKLAMYHRLQGDDVVFYKGDFRTFEISQIAEEIFDRLFMICPEIKLRNFTPEIKEYIRSGKLAQNPEFQEVAKQAFVRKWLNHARQKFRSGGYFEEPHWDRVCVTTLFTFYWDITIETIKFAQRIGKEVSVGGILASVVPNKVFEATGIKPHVGILKVKQLGSDKPLDCVIDELPLDYSILEEIDYKYPETNAFYSYTTRGCVNQCKFCAVPILEGRGKKHFVDYIPLKQRLKKTTERFGEQRHLLLLDNNVFASKKFDVIIDEIRDSNFGRGAKFTPPNLLNIAIRQLREGWNDRAYIRMAVRLLNEWAAKLTGKARERICSLLSDHELLHDYTATKENIFVIFDQIEDEYEKTRTKNPVARFVDFNQGMDARLATPEKMAKLAEVNIRPLRIAFDRWNERKHYVRAIKYAADNDIIKMSNYLLYNFTDDPVDLYRRLRLNIDLCDEKEALGVDIYSFPMKYHPIMDEKWFSNRDYIGPRWTRKAIRTVQVVLNSTHGKIGRGRTFFFKAFGRNEDEFCELIRMPEAFIVKRWDAEIAGLTDKWRKAYSQLTDQERSGVDSIIDSNAFENTDFSGFTPNVCEVLKFYQIKKRDIPVASTEEKLHRIKLFEKSCPSTISAECRALLKDAGQKQVNNEHRTQKYKTGHRAVCEEGVASD